MLSKADCSIRHEHASHAAYALDALQIVPLNISNSGMAVVGLTLQGTSKADRAADGFSMPGRAFSTGIAETRAECIVSSGWLHSRV